MKRLKGAEALKSKNFKLRICILELVLPQSGKERNQNINERKRQKTNSFEIIGEKLFEIIFKISFKIIRKNRIKMFTKSKDEDENRKTIRN